MFKFIHAADIHLDSPLLGLDRYQDAPVESIRDATRRAFANLVQLAIAERVSLVILAGDIYDGDWPDYNTGLFFVKHVRALEQAGIPVAMIRGNHDAESRITARLTLPAKTELPTDRPGTIRFDRFRVAVHGQGYARQAETRNLAAAYPQPIPDYFNIGVLHTALNGREGHLPYAPCTVEELVARGYDYWALGHVHQRESVVAPAGVRVEFPGNIQGRHIRETGAKGCLLVTVDDGGRATPEFRPLDVFRWSEIDVDAQTAPSMAEAIEIAARKIDDARLEADGRPLAVRVHVVGSGEISRQLAENLEQFRFELAARAGEHIWVEKIKPRQADQAPEAATVSGDAESELRATLADIRSNPETLQAIFAEGDCGKLRDRLPQNLRSILDAANHDEIVAMATVLLSAGPAQEAS